MKGELWLEEVCHWGHIPGGLHPATIPLSMFLVLQEAEDSPCPSLPSTPDVLPKNRGQRDKGLNSEILSSDKELLVLDFFFFLLGILSRKRICFHVSFHFFFFFFNSHPPHRGAV